MKREQIIEILERFITESDDYHDCILKYNFSRVADAILALSLDVPSNEEIEKTAMEYAPVFYFAETNDDMNAQIREEVDGLLKDMRDEIIKRNK